MARKMSSKKAQRESKTTSRARTKGARPNEPSPDNISPGNTAPDNNTPGNGIAATKVFGITELLERILLFTTYPHSKDTVKHSSDVMYHVHPDGQVSLSRLRLFAMQGVSKDFCGTIRGSARLKRAMFLLPYKNDYLKSLPATHTLPYHEPIISLLEQIQVRSGERQLMSWDIGNDSRSGFPTLAIQLRGGHVDFEESYLQVAFDKIPPAWLSPEASWRQIKICNAVKAVPLTVKIENNSWILGTDHLSWQLQGHDSLSYVFDLFRQLFEQIDERSATVAVVELGRDELEEEKWETEEEWREELKISRKAGTEKAHRAIVEEQRDRWIKRENQIFAEEKQMNDKWESWKRAVLMEQREE